VFSKADHADLTAGGPRDPLFYVASRGHHSEIGGITPGSMPPFSRTIEDEGILIDDFQLVSRGVFQEEAARDLLMGRNPVHHYPTRNIEQNLSDLRAQMAANAAGVSGTCDDTPCLV
jgi:5-oxoprolinase (ATP-hydrolysing)